MAPRRLPPGSPIPTAPPRRYNFQGYVILRWTIAPREQVEALEHRVVDGRVTTAAVVHHINGVKNDNRPENLEHLGGHREHQRAHGCLDGKTAAGLYASGLTQKQVAEALGSTDASVCRALATLGVQRRPPKRKHDYDAIARQYEGGASTAKLARKHGLNRGSVYAILIQEGVVPRTKSEACLLR